MQLSPIQIKGNAFWKDGKRFYIRGVVYQLTRQKQVDPLAAENLDQLVKAIDLFRELGLNTIYCYRVDNTIDHRQAMELLSRAGIYVIFCLSDPYHCINRLRPSESYNTALLEHLFRTVDCIADYPNTLGVFAANSVVNKVSTSPSAAYVKAVVRDVKRYMQSRRGGHVPVGVTNAVHPAIAEPLIRYLTAGEEDERPDFLGLNNYAPLEAVENDIWMDWNNLLALLNKVAAPVPMFVSEYGHNTARPQARTFDEVRFIYNSDTLRTLSGGCLYEFLEHTNRYGLVKSVDGELERLPDYINARARLGETWDIEDLSEDDFLEPGK